MTFKSTVISVEPTSEYQGEVYAQRVRVKLADGTEVALFDPNLELSQSHVNQHVRIDISVLVDKIELVTATDANVIPGSGEDNDWNGNIFVGEITRKESDDQYSTFTADVGVGDLNFTYKTEDMDEIENGDMVRLVAQRSDIKSMC